MIEGVHHISASTRDMKKILDFYCDVLGFDLITDFDWKPHTQEGGIVDRIIGLKNSEGKGAMVGMNGMIIEFFEYISPVPNNPPPQGRAYDYGYTHICLKVRNIDEEYERLRKAGMTFHGPPSEKTAMGLRAIYGADPEGNLIELLENIES